MKTFQKCISEKQKTLFFTAGQPETPVGRDNILPAVLEFREETEDCGNDFSKSRLHSSIWSGTCFSIFGSCSRIKNRIKCHFATCQQSGLCLFWTSTEAFQWVPPKRYCLFTFLNISCLLTFLKSQSSFRTYTHF